MKEYRLTSIMQFAFGIGLAGAIIGLLASASLKSNMFDNLYSFTNIYHILVILFFGYEIYFFGKIILISRIIVSEMTITYKSHGPRLVANWNDILRIGSKDRLFVHMEGLYIPGKSNSNDFIPLSYFSNNWRDSELGQQIKQHAPHLFQ